LSVSVREGGAAQRDGLRQGDRLVAVDGQRTSTWEAARSALSAAHAREQQGQAATARQIRIEREGKELTLAVIPDARGHIGVSPITALEPVSVGEALTEGVKYQLRIPAELCRIPQDDHPDLMGPIGIVRQTERSARSALFDFFVLVAGIGCWLTPACIVGHLVDAGTLRWFLAVNPEALTLDEELRRGFRVARLRQLLLLLSAWCACGLLLYAASVVPAFAIACAAWFGPLLTPVSWLLTREVRGRAAALLLLIGLGVPFLNLFLLWRLSLEARLYLRNRGIQVRWFRRQGEHGSLPPGEARS
jgi:hypothetical protein